MGFTLRIDKEKNFNALFVKRMGERVLKYLESIENNISYQEFMNSMHRNNIIYKRIDVNQELIKKHNGYLIFKDVRKLFGVLKNFKYFVYTKTTAEVENNVMLFEPIDRVFNDYLFFGLNLKENL